MTREEAIKILKAIRVYECYPKSASEETKEAIDMAIESLSDDAVPKLRQTDTLIIADALQYLTLDTERHLSDRTRADALREQFLKYGASMCHSADAEQKSDAYKRGFDDCKRAHEIELARSADAVQGEWTHDGSMWENRWVCDKCGHKIFERQTNFCPNCGAKMKGGDDE